MLRPLDDSTAIADLAYRDQHTLLRCYAGGLLRLAHANPLVSGGARRTDSYLGTLNAERINAPLLHGIGRLLLIAAEEALREQVLPATDGQLLLDFWEAHSSFIDRHHSEP